MQSLSKECNSYNHICIKITLQEGKGEKDAKEGEEDGQKEEKEDKSETDSDKKGEDTEEEDDEDEVDAEILATIEKFVVYGVQPEWMQIQRIINSKVNKELFCTFEYQRHRCIDMVEENFWRIG